jgi:hypothetical protein
MTVIKHATEEQPSSLPSRMTSCQEILVVIAKVTA